MAGVALRRRTQAPARGRPPRVSAAAIVAVAIDIGLSHVTLAEVAGRLGVTVPALYRHVRNRDEIVRLAAIQLAVKRGAPAGAARHWSEVVRSCADGMVELFVAEPQLICEVMNGTLGPDGEMDFVEQFLAALTPHGFTAAEGIRVHHAVAMLAIGAAVSATAMKSGYSGGASHESSIRAALARRGPQELPLVRSALPAYLHIDPQQWRESLDALVASIAARRGEILPPPAAAPRARTRPRK
ncbi:MAG: TetR family transcriptional regulator [Nevskia sp.]|nr:TetR family transcriptional regulator [Nevskia sp.]